jgi:hypothetical protein
MKAILAILGLILFSASGLEYISSLADNQLRSEPFNDLQGRRRLGFFSWLFGGDENDVGAEDTSENVPKKSEVEVTAEVTETIDAEPPPPLPSPPSEDFAPVSKLIKGKPREKQLKGKRVALLQVHFEGNVGDQMETIPLLQKLHSWGVIIDCYLSLWMPPLERLDPKVKERVAPYVNRIFEDGIGYDSNVQAWNYDMLIVTPGKCNCPLPQITHAIIFYLI